MERSYTKGEDFIRRK